MKYKGFYITKNYVSDIYRKDRYGSYKTCGGYRCRIYCEEDEHCKNILAITEFASGHELKFDDKKDEIDCIMEYVDSNIDFLNELKTSVSEHKSLPKSTVFSRVKKYESKQWQLGWLL